MDGQKEERDEQRNITRYRNAEIEGQGGTHVDREVGSWKYIGTGKQINHETHCERQKQDE